MVKALVTYEGVGQLLKADFDVAAVSQQHISRIFVGQFSPLRIAREGLRGAPELVDALVKAPMLVTEGLRFLEKTTRQPPENPLAGVRGTLFAGFCLVAGRDPGRLRRALAGLGGPVPAGPDPGAAPGPLTRRFLTAPPRPGVQQIVAARSSASSSRRVSSAPGCGRSTPSSDHRSRSASRRTSVAIADAVAGQHRLQTVPPVEQELPRGAVGVLADRAALGEAEDVGEEHPVVVARRLDQHDVRLRDSAAA